MKKRFVIATSTLLAVALLGTTPIVTTTVDASSTTTTTTKKSRIGLSKGKEIALKNAKLSSSDVTFTKAKYDMIEKMYFI